MSPKIRSTEENVSLIASAYLRQRFPLSELGMDLKEEMQALFATGKIPVKFMDILPTVENPRLELFAGLDLTEKEESKIFGSRLECIASSKGCTHMCVHCYEDAQPELKMTPFAALLRMSEAKKRWEQRIRPLWDDWVSYLREEGVTDLEMQGLDDLVKTMNWEELELLSISIKRDCWKLHPLSKLTKLKPFPGLMPLSIFHQVFSECLPVTLGSLEHMIYNYLDSDPFDYRDGRFLHLDGTPADYGDVFCAMTTEDRPVGISTAGWFPENKLGCRAAGKIISSCVQNPGLLGLFRISVSPWEHHSVEDQRGYIGQIVSMIREVAPLSPDVVVYHNQGSMTGNEVTQKFANYFACILEDTGFKGRVGTNPVSHLYGRSKRLANKPKIGRYDPFAQNDGFFILHDGEVREAVGSRWYRDKMDGKVYYIYRTPNGWRPKPREKWLFRLQD